MSVSILGILMIIGIVILSLLFLAGIIVLIVFLVRRNRNS